jgi:hypothetical protein
MKLGLRYESMRIMPADAGETRELLELAGLPDIWAQKSLALVLGSTMTTGLVLCHRVSALEGPADPGSPHSRIDVTEIWHSR